MTPVSRRTTDLELAEVGAGRKYATVSKALVLLRGAYRDQAMHVTEGSKFQISREAKKAAPFVVRATVTGAR